MAVGATVVLLAALNQSMPLYLAGFILLFVFSGIGNGSVYKMIPAIFQAKAATKVSGGMDLAAAAQESQRLSGALIGIAGADRCVRRRAGEPGVPPVVPRRPRARTRRTSSFIVFYAICFAVTWAVYIRKSKHSLEGV